jgi:hypothetical protein
LRASSLFEPPDNGDSISGDVGDIPFGLCEADGPAESGLSELLLVEILVSDALRNSFPAPIPFFCLNFSNQIGLLTFTWLSLFPTVVEKNIAFSLIASSVN